MDQGQNREIPAERARASATGVVIRGHRVASGACGDPRFPAGTIAPQLPFFRDRVPGFEAYLGGPAFPGTLNLSFPGMTVRLGTPEIRVPEVRWTHAFPPENFFLSRCLLVVEGLPPAPAYLYVPDPATKPDHLQPGSIVELLAAHIAALRYGTQVELRYDPAALSVEPGEAARRDGHVS